MTKIFENEKILDDSYPVYWDYLYVADGVLIRSDIQGTVRDLKHYLTRLKKSCEEIRSANIIARKKDYEERKTATSK